MRHTVPKSAMALRCFAATSLIALAACAVSSPEAMNQTLPYGSMYRDGITVKSLGDLRKDKPVAVFLHGCAGMNGRQYNVMNLIDPDAFEIVAPNSFVPGRQRPKCTGRFMQYRDEDIQFVLGRLRVVTVQPIVLVGFSEGGRAVAAYSGDIRVAGKAILSYDCYHGVNENAPVLNIQGLNDNEIARGNSLCPVKNSHYVNTGHDISFDPEAKLLLQKFMRGVL